MPEPAAPRLTIVLRNLAKVLWKSSWRLRMGLVVAVLTVIMAAAAVLAVCALLMWRSTRQLPTNARPVIWEALRHDRSLRFTYLALALCSGVFGAIVITGINTLAVVVWLILGLLGVMALWSRIRLATSSPCGVAAGAGRIVATSALPATGLQDRAQFVSRPALQRRP